MYLYCHRVGIKEVIQDKYSAKQYDLTFSKYCDKRMKLPLNPILFTLALVFEVVYIHVFNSFLRVVTYKRCILIFFLLKSCLAELCQDIQLLSNFSNLEKICKNLKVKPEIP